jgi:putative membrane-bound dehydrogenase-like protein
MNRFLASLLFAIGTLPFQDMIAKEITGERAPAATVCPSPEDARARMSVPEGYEVRCFAHEPMIVNPVAMTWDHRGRLWVVEGYEYPNGSEFKGNAFGIEARDDHYHAVPAVCQAKDNPLNAMRQDHPRIPKDRVIILEDTDNNGEADKRTVFVEGLDMGSAILCGDGGIYVGQQPHLLHFKDTDGDDHADEWRVVLTGFGREDTHELLNSFCWGPDGWLYMTHGVFTNSKVRRPGQPESEGFKFDAGIGRARPMSRGKEPQWEFEVFADGTSNPWGCDYDAAGNFFVSACVIDHFFHMAPGGIYVRQGGAPENPYSYELLPSIVKHKHFRAAYAGVQIYQGGRYPADTNGHAFIGNIHDNAIHEEVLTPVGATFKCEPRRDFLRANDGWFRPVSTQTGPDGFLWIMDWCDKYPCYQNAKANPEGVDRERGRIWRVVHEKEKGGRTLLSAASEESPKEADKSVRAPLDLQKLSTADLVKTLEHPNNWMRRMARRMLVEKEYIGFPDNEKALEASVIYQTLKQTLASNDSTDKKLSALSILTQIAGDDIEGGPSPVLNLCVPLLKDREPALRAWAIHYLAEEKADTTDSLGWVVGEASKLAGDPDPMVRLAAANAWRFMHMPRLNMPMWMARQEHLPLQYHQCDADAVASFMKASVQPGDDLLPFAIWMAMEPFFGKPEHIGWEAKIVEQFAKTAPTTEHLSRVLSHKAMRRLCDTRKAENLDLAVEFCDKIAAHDILLAHSLDGLVKGQEGGVIKPVKDVSASLTKWRESSNADVRKHAQTLAVLWGDEAAVTEMISALHDAKKPEKDRIAVLQSLRKVKTDAVKEGLKPLLTPGTSTTLGVAAIRAAADLGGDDFIAPLLTQAASKDFNIRIAAIEALSSRAMWTKAMLDAISEGKIGAGGFPAPVRRALATSKDKATRDHAFKVLGAWQDSSEDVKALIAAKKQACLTGEPDLANGKLIFTATCMVCHEFHGGGQKVGPDLIGSGRSNLDAILANVIDPNQIIGNGYENFTVATKDGRTLAGRVVEDTPGHVKLLGAGGAAQVVPRDQIATLTNSKQSLMPMGFGGLPDAIFRDLIWYILAPPEEGPLTKSKKDLLIKGVETNEPAKPKGNNSRAIDWESVSLWNPDWKVNAPDFERTPLKLAEYHGKTNVLLMHPFEKTKPAGFERKLKIEAGRTKLKFSVAADDRGDWTLKATVDGVAVKELAVDHEKPRWKTVEIDLTKFSGQEVTLRLEAHASGWSWEFAYWGGIVLE